jgi:riboflavin-specific deaminase-like protein
MRQIVPSVVDDVDVTAAYTADPRPAHDDGRPWLLLNMVASADGATAVDGVSGTLGGDVDRAAFFAIRSVADVILAGAGTVRAEGYGPPRPSPAVRAARVERGQAPAPRLAVMSASLQIEPTARFLAEAEADNEPWIITAADADPDRMEALRAAGAEVIAAGEGSVDVAAAVAELGRRGMEVVLCEGGPMLNGQLIAADLVDEVCLTLAPDLAVGDSARVAHGPTITHPVGLRLDRAIEADSTLLLRYVRG